MIRMRKNTSNTCTRYVTTLKTSELNAGALKYMITYGALQYQCHPPGNLGGEREGVMSFHGKLFLGEGMG